MGEQDFDLADAAAEEEQAGAVLGQGKVLSPSSRAW